MQFHISCHVMPVTVPNDQTRLNTGRHEERALSQKRCTAESASRKRRQQKLLAKAEVRNSSCLQEDIILLARDEQGLALCRLCCLLQRRGRQTRRAPVRMPWHTGRRLLHCKAA